MTDAEIADPDFAVNPRWWVDRSEVEARLAGRWERGWLIGWRDIARNTDVRTVIASVIPRVAVGNKIPLIMTAATPRQVAGLVGNLCAFAFDYTARQKIGGASLNYFILEQLPVLTPAVYDDLAPWRPDIEIGEWMAERVVELCYSAWDLRPFASDLGWDCPPFRCDPERRLLLRAEIDAAFFHLYGLAEEDVDYVMETFPIVKSRDEATHGHFRTKALILDIYRNMAEAIAAGVPHETILDPRPADQRAGHSSDAGRQPTVG